MVTTDREGRAWEQEGRTITSDELEDVLSHLRRMNKNVGGYIESASRYDLRSNEHRDLLIQAARQAEQSLHWLANSNAFIRCMGHAEDLSARYGDEISNLRGQFREFTIFEKLLLNMSGFSGDIIVEFHSQRILDTTPTDRHVAVVEVVRSIGVMQHVCNETAELLERGQSLDRNPDSRGENFDIEYAGGILKYVPTFAAQTAATVLNVGVAQLIHIHPVYATLSTQLGGGVITDIIKDVTRMRNQARRRLGPPNSPKFKAL